MLDAIAVSSAIRSARVALGWTQRTLSTSSGVSEVTIARFEAGMTSPRLSTIKRLVDAIEDAGVAIVAGTPERGYSLAVSEKALHAAL